MEHLRGPAGAGSFCPARHRLPGNRRPVGVAQTGARSNTFRKVRRGASLHCHARSAFSPHCQSSCTLLPSFSTLRNSTSALLPAPVPSNRVPAPSLVAGLSTRGGPCPETSLQCAGPRRGNGSTHHAPCLSTTWEHATQRKRRPELTNSITWMLWLCFDLTKWERSISIATDFSDLLM